MKLFLKNLAIFTSILILLITVGIFIPPTPRATTSLLFSKIEKDSLLSTVDSPRIILIGGSNVSLSINSQIIKDSLDLNPVNTAVSAHIGLAYMLDNSLDYVKPNDVIIVSPEYSQFFDNVAYGNEDLLRTILDLCPKDIFNLRKKQLLNILKFIPKYSLSKFKFSEYLHNNDDDSGIYQRQSYNKYGDLYKHWTLTRQEFSPLIPPSEYDHSVAHLLYAFKREVEAKGGRLFITFPALQETSYEMMEYQIAMIEEDLKNKGFTLVGSPERYKTPDDLMFDSPYHLTKEGVDRRTNLLIHDLQDLIAGN